MKHTPRHAARMTFTNIIRERLIEVGAKSPRGGAGRRSAA